MKFFAGVPMVCFPGRQASLLSDVLKENGAGLDETASGDRPVLLVENRCVRGAGVDAAHLGLRAGGLGLAGSGAAGSGSSGSGSSGSGLFGVDGAREIAGCQGGMRLQADDAVRMGVEVYGGEETFPGPY